MRIQPDETNPARLTDDARERTENRGDLAQIRGKAARALAVIAVAAILVFSPSLTTPFLLDDYLHVSMLEGTFPAKRSAFDLYNFINDEDRPVLVERGMLPWWSHPKLQVRFFRPLSSALRWADHQALGAKPLLLHVHSFAWWALAVLAVRRLFQRALSPRATTFATIAFALAPCHALPLAWIANREALISLALGAAGLDAYMRFRDRGKVSGALVAALAFGLSMLGGEYAFAIAGYVIAREIVARDGLVKRAASALAFGAPAAVYLYARAKLGYGSFASGFYTDPFRETGAFLREVPRRAATLIAEGWMGLDDETITPATPGIALALALAALVALVASPIRRAMADLDDERRRTLSWLLLGSLLAIPPVLAVMPSPRLLGASMIGVAAVVGLLLDRAWFPRGEPDGSWASRVMPAAALALGFAHLVHGPVTSFLIGRRFHRSAVDFRVYATALRERIGDTDDAEVFVLRAMGGSFFLPFALNERGKPPLRFRILSHTGHVLVLGRDDHTFDLIVAPDQALFPSGFGSLFRNRRDKLSPGAIIDIPGVRATVLDVGRHGPRAARFEVDHPLDAPSLVWITEGHKGFPEATLPSPGFGKPFDP